jgi:hypothetical protein
VPFSLTRPVMVWAKVAKDEKKIKNENKDFILYL